eukprot:364216-Chlamydomonas_euryale.AAC.8
MPNARSYMLSCRAGRTRTNPKRRFQARIGQHASSGPQFHHRNNGSQALTSAQTQNVRTHASPPDEKCRCRRAVLTRLCSLRPTKSFHLGMASRWAGSRTAPLACMHVRARMHVCARACVHACVR